VAIDVRGSGASFGHRQQEWSPDEVRDGAEVVDWIIRQPWSNGRVGATGISYEGISSELLLVNQHPAVKAVAPRFSAFDLYGDLVMPGGIYHNLNDLWGPYVSALDNNNFGPQFLSTGPRLVSRGDQSEDRDEHLLQAAVREHNRNVNVQEDLQYLSQG
jgi:putative CocE/NonD family hydrolase